MELSALGDDAVVIEWGGIASEATLAKVSAAVTSLEADPPPGLLEIVPAFTSVTVFYDALHVLDFESFAREVLARIERKMTRAHVKPQTLTIPVCYGQDFGPDLTAVAHHTGMTEEQVVQLHAAETYTVGAIGFTPGFPYLIGLPEKLHTPRRSTPRQSVPAGSVAIGGAQTGVYPLASPGGWNLIGRTPLGLFAAENDPPARLRVGDQVKFKLITAEEFAAWR